MEKVIDEELTYSELLKIMGFLNQLKKSGFKHVIIGINKIEGVINLETRHSIVFV